MIWALLALYFFGGGGVGSGAILTSSGVDDLAGQVKMLIEDDAREKSAVGTLKQLKKDVKAFEKAYGKSGKRLNKLYKDHAENRDEVVALLDELNAEWQRGQEHALDARFELRDKLTEEEWAELFGDTD